MSQQEVTTDIHKAAGEGADLDSTAAESEPKGEPVENTEPAGEAIAATPEVALVEDPEAPIAESGEGPGAEVPGNNGDSPDATAEAPAGEAADAPMDENAEEQIAEAAEDVESGSAPEVSLVEDPEAPVTPVQAEPVGDEVAESVAQAGVDEAAEPPSYVEQAGTSDSAIAEELAADAEAAADAERARLKAVIEAMIYITDEPLTLQQIAAATARPNDFVRSILDDLVEEYGRPDRGLSIRELAGGFKLSTKPEHHEEIRQFVKNLKPPLKLSLAALETLAVIAYKQPITAPEIMEIRGVQGAGVLKTLLDRKLIATAGRKNVVGKPILYKSTREFLIQFGLKDLSELPTLKEFEELGRLALTDEPSDAGAPETAQASPEPPPPSEEPPIEEPGPEPPPVEEPPAPPDEPHPPERVDAEPSE